MQIARLELTKKGCEHESILGFNKQIGEDLTQDMADLLTAAFEALEDALEVRGMTIQNLELDIYSI